MLKVGDRICHKGIPFLFPMKIHGIKPCVHGKHSAFQIIDPEGHKDWLCELDVDRAEKESEVNSGDDTEVLTEDEEDNYSDDVGDKRKFQQENAVCKKSRNVRSALLTVPLETV